MTATIAEHKAAANRQKLATAIGQVVKNFTMQNPDMSQDEVIAVLGFCAGSAIGAADARFNKRSLGEIAVRWMDDGLQVATGKKSATVIMARKLN